MATRRFPILVLLGTLLSLSPLVAASSWSVDLAWPTIAPGAWTPLVGSAPAEVQEWTLAVSVVSVSGKESLPLEYRQAVGGEFEVPVYIDDGTRELRISFLVGGVAVEQRRLSLGDRLFPGHLIGVAGLSTSDRAALSDLLLPQEPVRVMPLPPALWPTSALAFGGLSAAALADPGPVLSPAQLRAVRAWVASGGQLVIVGRAPGGASLAAQLGPVEGLGRVTTLPVAPARWDQALPLRPYGQARPWGSDFDPAPRGVSGVGTPAPTVAVVMILVWAAVGSLILILQRRGGAGLPLTWAGLGTLAVLVLWGSGSLAWDGGLLVHGREIVLPSQSGRFVLLEVRQPAQRSGFLGWPEASPWALTRWKASFNEAEAVPRSLSESRAVFASFLPFQAREPQFAVTWTGTARWSDRQGGQWRERETVPEALTSDAPWLEKLAATAPGTRWRVGLDGRTCWTEPEWGGRP